MIYNMKLHNEPFKLIKNGSKNIELRLNDEKRSVIKENDVIIFKNKITEELIKTKVVKLHKYFDKIRLGYKEDEIASPSDMEIYYSKKAQKKYNVLGIEIQLIKVSKKEIIYNNDMLNLKNINNVVRRAKILIKTSDNRFVICHSDKNYHLIGGHVENEELDTQCLTREILEEAGVYLELDSLDPFITIKYFNKDYPQKGINTLSIANYYFLINDLKPNLSNISLTEEELKGNFKLEFIDCDKSLYVLENSLKTASRKNVTLDTIEVIKEYLKTNN